MSDKYEDLEESFKKEASKSICNLVEEGILEIVGVDEDGEMLYQLTTLGKLIGNALLDDSQETEDES